MKFNDQELIERAKSAMQKAYAPYSDFFVGAALLCTDGTVYTGCNVENASFSPTCCAERVALFKAISEGKRDFCAIAIVGGKAGSIGDFCYPCGVCRQVLAEFCDAELKVIIFDGNQTKSVTLGELLPSAFNF